MLFLYSSFMKGYRDFFSLRMAAFTTSPRNSGLALSRGVTRFELGEGARSCLVL